MKRILEAIFKPKDGTRKRVTEEVMASRDKVTRAANRFEETVRDLIDHNDNLTGRKPNVRINKPSK